MSRSHRSSPLLTAPCRSSSHRFRFTACLIHSRATPSYLPCAFSFLVPAPVYRPCSTRTDSAQGPWVLKKKRKKKEKRKSLLENPATAKVRIRPRCSIYTCATCDPQLHFHAVRLSPCPRLSPRIPQCSSRAVTFWVSDWWDIWSRVENFFFFWESLEWETVFSVSMKIISRIMWISLIPQFIWDTTGFTRSNPDGEVDENKTLYCVTSQLLIKGLSRSGRPS